MNPWPFIRQKHDASGTSSNPGSKDTPVKSRRMPAEVLSRYTELNADETGDYYVLEFAGLAPLGSVSCAYRMIRLRFDSEHDARDAIDYLGSEENKKVIFPVSFNLYHQRIERSPVPL